MRAAPGLVAVAAATAWYAYKGIAVVQRRAALATSLLADARASMEHACTSADAAVHTLRSLPGEVAWQMGEQSLHGIESAVRTLGRILVAW